MVTLQTIKQTTGATLFKIMSYTKNEIALETLISNVNSFFYYVGEDDDSIPFPRYEIRERLDRYVSQFMQSIEVEGDDD